jgi:hypothetical protein
MIQNIHKQTFFYKKKKQMKAHNISLFSRLCLCLCVKVMSYIHIKLNIKLPAAFGRERQQPSP